MLPRKESDEVPPKVPMTEAEARAFVEQCVDWLLGSTPAYELSMHFVRAVQNPDQYKSGIAFMRLDPSVVIGSSEARELAAAIENRDRKKIIDLFLPIAGRWSKEAAQDVLVKLSSLPLTLRERFEDVGKSIKLKVGPTPKAVVADYPKIAALGDRLAPVIEKLLQELALGTNHTLQEQLEFGEKDQPQECDFLMKHLTRLESILKDENLLKRAKLRKARSRLIADAMAGAECGYEPRTSVERAREGRRMVSRRNSQE